MPSIWEEMWGIWQDESLRAVCRNIKHRAVHEVEQANVELDEYTEEDRQIDRVIVNFINSNAKNPGIIAKVKTSSYQKSVKNFI